VTSGVNERPYLSIGEVLGLLLDEFPDVTISKIRFLESQGLIEPERTSSGYRKFFDADIERLKVILREQRENFLPLRVIRDRLETGEIDDSGAIVVPTDPVPVPPVVTTPDPVPAAGAPASATSSGTVSQLHRGIRNVRVNGEVTQPRGRPPFDDDDDDTDGLDLDDTTGTANPAASEVDTNRHPAAQARPLAAVRDQPADPTPTGMLLRDDAPLDLLSRAELCQAAALTTEQLASLESYGLVTPRGTGSNATYTSGDLAIVRAAAGFLQRGVDARHLRGWRQSAEREVGLFEQRILPLLRQRNPQARHDAVQLVTELADLGAELRQALIVAMLRPHLDT
jgi:DNA-binding transcriptional MerR regulator